MPRTNQGTPPRIADANLRALHRQKIATECCHKFNWRLSLPLRPDRGRSHPRRSDKSEPPCTALLRCQEGRFLPHQNKEKQASLKQGRFSPRFQLWQLPKRSDDLHSHRRTTVTPAIAERTEGFPSFFHFSCFHFFVFIVFFFIFSCFSFFARVGNHAKRAQVHCALWMIRAVFTLSDLGPRRLSVTECEENVTVVSTVTGCDVTNCATTLHGFNKHASSRREAVSDSRGVPRCTEKISQTLRLLNMCRSFDSSNPPYPNPVTRRVTRRHGTTCQVNSSQLSSVPMPSIDLNLWNRSRPSTFVPISLGFTSVLTDDIVRSFRNTKT